MIRFACVSQEFKCVLQNFFPKPHGLSKVQKSYTALFFILKETRLYAAPQTDVASECVMCTKEFQCAPQAFFRNRID